MVSSTSELPIRFGNSLFINAAFPLPTRSARPLLPDSTRLNLVEVFPGRAVLVVSFALYRESPFGAYSEAVLALMASHEKTTPVMTLKNLLEQSRYPAYVLHMLVSSEQAQQQGMAVWALPRLLADVRLEHQDRQMVCHAVLDGQTVLQFVADHPVANRTRTMQIETYSQRDDTLLHTVMHCHAGIYGRIMGGGASITWGDHPIGQQFAAMQVSSLPLMMRYYDQMQAELGPPAVV